MTGDRSNIFIEEAMTKTQVNAGRRFNGDKNRNFSKFILHPTFTNPIPRTEGSLERKLARKVSKRSKKDLRGLWETLAPGSTVVRTSSTTTTAIKEPGVPEVKVRNSRIAKFVIRAEQITELWQYAQRRPLPYDKTTEEKIAQNSKDSKKKCRVDIKIRHSPTQTDVDSGISSANSNIFKALSSRKPKKPQAGTGRSRQYLVTLNTSNASSVAASSITSSTTSPTTSRSKRTRKALHYFSFESSVCSVSDKYSASAPERHKSINTVIKTVIQEEALQPPADDNLFDLRVVSPPATPPVGTWSVEENYY